VMFVVSMFVMMVMMMVVVLITSFSKFDFSQGPEAPKRGDKHKKCEASP
jgi:hypothetical protein